MFFFLPPVYEENTRMIQLSFFTFIGIVFAFLLGNYFSEEDVQSKSSFLIKETERLQSIDDFISQLMGDESSLSFDEKFQILKAHIKENKPKYKL